MHVRNGASAARRNVVIQMNANPNPTENVRVGFTATKKTGNAVKRNRAKRRLRECARYLLPLHGQPGNDYVFIARMGTAEVSWDLLVKDVEKALSRL